MECCFYYSQCSTGIGWFFTQNNDKDKAVNLNLGFGISLYFKEFKKFYSHFFIHDPIWTGIYLRLICKTTANHLTPFYLKKTDKIHFLHICSLQFRLILNALTRLILRLWPIHSYMLIWNKKFYF